VSLKEGISQIKDELDSQERFLESIIKLERFFKKHLKSVVFFIVLVIVVVFTMVFYDYLKTDRLKESNKIYLSLLKSPDEISLKRLEDINVKLSNLYRFQVALKSGDISKLKEIELSVKDPILENLLKYQISSLEEKGLLKYSQMDNTVLKDLSIIEAAIISFENNSSEKAEDILSFIGSDSSFYQMKQSLKHYIK
jgi:predicted negative regulator of RcsB-dependent stress response